MPKKTKKKEIPKLMTRYKKVLILGGALFFIVVFGLGSLVGYFFFKPDQKTTERTGENIYIEFLSEVYDKIKENYWETITDENLTSLFKLASEQLVRMPQPVLESNNKEGLTPMWLEILKSLKDEQKKEFATKTAGLVLANLKPVGRNGLYTQQDQETLKNKVENIRPDVDLYQTLGISKEADQEEINQAHASKISQLQQEDQTPEVQTQIEEVNYAFEVLSEAAKKERYDQSKVEPTVFTELLRSDINYIQITKFSPTTLEEFIEASNKTGEQEHIDSLILDLRNNIGGSIDILPYLLGLFIGKNQYAFEFFHQGEYSPFKTQTTFLPSLNKYKRVVVLIDSQTQSTAELMAASIKKYNVGIVVGSPSRGWGTIEKVFTIDKQFTKEETYSMFLVHSVSLREDSQPIEGRGVDPQVNIEQSNWQNELFEYFRHQRLIEVVEELVS